MKRKTNAVAFLLSMLCIIALMCPVVAYATGDSLDELAGQSTDPNANSQTDNTAGTTAGAQSDDGKAIEDYLKGYTPVTGENMEKASTVASPIVSAIGTISGFIVMVVSAAIFMVTALDLAYIGLPFTRGLLNPQYAAAAAGGAGGAMPGMMGGMGMRGGMMGGMMGGAMGGGGAQPAMEHGIRRKWVSDEAVYCVQTYAAGGAPQQAIGGGMPMGGMPMGGMPMGGMQMGGAQQAAMPMKSVILEYLKKRSFFLIIFAVATVILMSSLLTDCGLNLATLLTKVINRFSGQLGTINF